MNLEERFEQRLETKKRESMLQVLFKCSRLLNEYAIGLMRERTGYPVRAAHTTLFPHIDLAGTRLTVLADRLGVSKQAVGQLVNELEDIGMLERRPDPSDGRARLVCFSEDGKKGLFQGLALLKELEGQVEKHIGTSHMDGLRAGLDAVMANINKMTGMEIHPGQKDNENGG